MPYILALLLVLVSPVLGHAAATCVDAGAVDFYDATPLDPETGSANYTPPGTANRITHSGFGHRRGSGALTVTGTLGGNAMTQISTTGYQDPAAASLFNYINAAASSLAVVFDPVGTPLADAIITSTCTGVNTTLDGDSGTPYRSFVTNQGSGTTATCTPPSVQATDIVLSFFYKDNSSNFTLGANETLIKQGNDGSESAAIMSWHSGALGAASSHTLASEQWACVAVVLRAASSGRHTIAPFMENW